ncbi:MAG: RNA polymerase sigma factor [Planctomycetota bacterium]|nr:MAG: RNA polymerase sigma factor [Planctomycetota bacterium]
MSDVDAHIIDSAAERMLVQQALQDDHEAWGQLMRHYAPRLAAYIGARLRRHKVVERLVAETIYVAWRHRHEYAQGQDFATWLRRIAANLALRWHRRHQGEPLVEAFPRERCEGMQQYATMQALDNALGNLQDRQRMALEQHYRGGLEGEALAAALHVPPDDVDGVVQEALEALDKALANGGAS